MSIPLTVIGTDATGQVFKEHTLVLGLSGRDCQYQSKHQVEKDGSLLLYFEYMPDGKKPRGVQGRVKALQESRTDRRLFDVSVELDIFQTVIVIPDDPQDFFKMQVDSLKRLLDSTHSAEKDGSAPQMKTTSEALAPPPHVAEETIKVKDVDAAESDGNVALTIPKLETPAIPEIGHPFGTLKAALSREIEDSARTAVTSLGDKFLTYSQDAAGVMVERLNGLSQTVVLKIEEDLNARVTSILQSADERIVEMQDKVNDSQASAAGLLDKVQTAKEEVGHTTERMISALKLVQEAAESAEQLNESLPSRLDAWTTELKTRIDQIMAENTTRWTRTMEERMAPYLQGIDDRLQTLAAGMELAQRQQDRLADLSRTAAARFEKDMRAVFLRMSSND